MATHSSILAWRIPWTGEPGGLPSMGLHRVGHNRSDLAAVAACLMEKTLESPLKSKAIKPVDPKGNQSWIFIRRTDAETEAPTLWPPDEKSQHIRKDPDAGKHWGQEEKGMTEDEMVGWHHWCDGHEFEQASGDGEGLGSLVCFSPRGRKELEMTERLNNSNNTLASLVWGLEASQQCENFFGMIVLQFVGHPPGSSVVELMVELW